MDKLAGHEFVLLDDDEVLLKLEKHMLKQLGATHISTYQSVDKLTPDFHLYNIPNAILLCDLKLPDIDGVEFIRQLAKEEYQGYLLIVSGTEHRVIDSVIAMAKGLNLKVLGGIQKPINPSLFFKTLQKLQYKEQNNVVSKNYEIDIQDLKNALNNEDIFLVYQPKIRINDNKFIGAEVLARWKHPQYDIIPPLVFIELAEKNGLISEVTHYILAKAFEQLSKWTIDNLTAPISINISETDLQHLDTPEHIVKLAKQYDIDMSLLTLEVTESCLMVDLPKTLDVISRLRIRNIGLSIDDFGTGYSSLEKLRDLPFTELKIDKTFVQNIEQNKDDYNIVRSNIELAKMLGLQTVAEGVEKQGQIDILRQLNCDVIQGYFYSQPLSGDEFEKWLRKYQLAHV